MDKKWDSACFPVIEEAQFVHDYESICERAKTEGPFMIKNQDGRQLILFSFDDYFNRFGILYPPGEKERIEAECRRLYQEQEE